MPDVQQHGDPQTNRVNFHTPRLSLERRALLESTLALMVDSGVSMRERLDENLDIWTNMYDMRVKRKDFPWPNAANMFVPLIPSNLDTVASRLMQLVVPARLFVVKGRTAEAEQQSNLVERWYNSKLIRNDWPNSIYQFVHLALRDGTCIMECVWEKKIHSMNLAVDEPETGPDGMPLFDENDEPLVRHVVRQIDIVDYNDVRWQPVELRDFYLFPAWARNIDEAASVGRVLYLSESEMKAMAKAGTLNREKVEYVISTINGEAELPQDQHVESYTVSGQVDVSTPSWTDQMGKNQQALYYKVWRIHTREFDLDGDGVFEENMLFYHEYTKTLIGWQHFPYAHGKRPFVPFSPLERPNRFYGYSVCERLYGLQVEVNAIHNQRRDEIDLRTSPPLLRTAGATPDIKGRAWGPATMWTVGSMQDIQLLQLPEVPMSSWQEEQMINTYAQQLLGLADQAMGVNAGGRRTKYEMQIMAAAISVRMSLMASRLQRALQALFVQTHELELQYAPEQQAANLPGTPPSELTVDKNVLGLDYELGINGMGSVLDRQARRQEVLFLYNVLMQNPLVGSNLERVFALTRRVLEEFEIEDSISIIGTAQDAQQQMQQMALKQQQMAEQRQQEPPPQRHRSGQHRRPKHGQPQEPMAPGEGMA